MTQNSALSQNWVECTVYTPMAQAAHRPRAHCAQAVRTVPCLNAHWAVSWHALASYRGRARLCRNAHWPCREHTLLCRLPFRSRYKNRIATQLPAARTALCVHARCHAHFAACRGRCRTCRNAPALCHRALLRCIAALVEAISSCIALTHILDCRQVTASL